MGKNKNRNTGEKFDSFYNDHFGFRLRLVTFNTHLHASLFGISCVPRVIIGKYGWLFHNDYGPADPRGCAGWHGYNPYSLDQLMAIQKHLEDESAWFAKRNITFLILPCPEKISIYPEFLPWRFNTVVGPSRLAQIFNHMKLHSKLQLVDIRQALLSAKKSQELNVFYKTDYHWNNVGAFFAYEEIMKRLLVVYPHFVPHRYQEFDQDRQWKTHGDLADVASLDMFEIFEHKLVPRPNVSFDTLGAKKGKLLIFGDSFSAFYLDGYLRRHFHNINISRDIRSAISKLDKKVVLEYRPDVVILESVERCW
ncbi:unnamed protein product, partial [Rotaria magnacalcarata]